MIICRRVGNHPWECLTRDGDVLSVRICSVQSHCSIRSWLSGECLMVNVWYYCPGTLSTRCKSLEHRAPVEMHLCSTLLNDKVAGSVAHGRHAPLRSLKPDPHLNYSQHLSLILIWPSSQVIRRLGCQRSRSHGDYIINNSYQISICISVKTIMFSRNTLDMT